MYLRTCPRSLCLIEKDSTNFQKIEKFVIQMYSTNLETVSVDEARMIFFAQNQNMERIPPTCDALLHHVKRAAYQTGKRSP